MKRCFLPFPPSLDATVPDPEFTQSEHIPLTTHSDAFGVDPVPVSWGHPDPAIRAPVICTVRHASQRNAIGAHQGSYCIYTGLAVAAKKLDPDYVPDLRLTSPVFQIGPYPSWSDPKKISGESDCRNHNRTRTCSFQMSITISHRCLSILGCSSLLPFLQL